MSITTRSGVHYFRLPMARQSGDCLSGNHYLSLDTNPLLSPFALGMGWYRNYGSRWLENDGVGNTYSMKAPFGHPVVEFTGTPQAGKWNRMGFSQRRSLGCGR